MYINHTVLQNIKRKHFFGLYCIYMYIDTMYVARAAQLPWSTIGRALAQKPGGHGVQVMSKAAPVVFNFVMYCTCTWIHVYSLCSRYPGQFNEENLRASPGTRLHLHVHVHVCIHMHEPTLVVVASLLTCLD